MGNSNGLDLAIFELVHLFINPSFPSPLVAIPSLHAHSLILKLPCFVLILSSPIADKLAQLLGQAGIGLFSRSSLHC
jgi:hypothetical protein